MVLRRPHRKSRNGCLTCKSRRVKCDEGGPPCGPCALRSVECRYARVVTPQRRVPEQHDDERTPVPPQEPTVIANWPQSVRLLELELIQHWTSTGYKSYCGTVREEDHNWQVVVPKLALKYDCLLDGLFAMSALEIGAFSEESVSWNYIDAALDYQNRGSEKLRNELSHADFASMPVEKHQALWALASILMVLALAVPTYSLQSEDNYSMLDHIMTFCELVKGLAIIVTAKGLAIKDDPLLSKYKQWDELDILPVEPEMQTAIDRLKQLNEETYGVSRVKGEISELQALTYHAACRRAILFLEELLAKCSESHTRGYGLAWVLQSGCDFIAALKAKEPLPLLILCHWGAFLEKQSYGIWYVERVGKCLVEDLSRETYRLDNEKARESTSWVRRQVGLDAEIA